MKHYFSLLTLLNKFNIGTKFRRQKSIKTYVDAMKLRSILVKHLVILKTPLITFLLKKKGACFRMDSNC